MPDMSFIFFINKVQIKKIKKVGSCQAYVLKKIFPQNESNFNTLKRCFSKVCKV